MIFDNRIATVRALPKLMESCGLERISAKFISEKVNSREIYKIPTKFLNQERNFDCRDMIWEIYRAFYRENTENKEYEIQNTKFERK